MRGRHRGREEEFPSCRDGGQGVHADVRGAPYLATCKTEPNADVMLKETRNPDVIRMLVARMVDWHRAWAPPTECVPSSPFCWFQLTLSTASVLWWSQATTSRSKHACSPPSLLLSAQASSTSANGPCRPRPLLLGLTSLPRPPPPLSLLLHLFQRVWRLCGSTAKSSAWSRSTSRQSRMCVMRGLRGWCRRGVWRIGRSRCWRTWGNGWGIMCCRGLWVCMRRGVSSCSLVSCVLGLSSLGGADRPDAFMHSGVGQRLDYHLNKVLSNLRSVFSLLFLLVGRGWWGE